MNTTQPLTAEAIDAMEAGREMDALVAEHVMGWRNCRPVYGAVAPNEIPDDVNLADLAWYGDKPSGILDGWWPTPIPSYSTDIAAAWKVVERMKALGLDITLMGEWGGEAPWYCALRRYDDASIGGGLHDEYIVYAATAPLAICRAALKATLHP